MRSSQWGLVVFYALTVLCGLIAILAVLCNLGTPAVDEAGPDSLIYDAGWEEWAPVDVDTLVRWDVVVEYPASVVCVESFEARGKRERVWVGGVDTLFIVVVPE